MEDIFENPNILKWREHSLLSETERKEALSILQNKGAAFNLLSEKARADKEMALYGVHFFSWNILYCPFSLQCDIDLISISVLKESKILTHLPKHLLSDKKIAKHLLDLELKKEQDTLSKNGGKYSTSSANNFIDHNFNNNNNSCFQHFNKNVRSDPLIYELAMHVNFLNYKYISYKLKDNVQIALKAIGINPRSYYLFTETLKSNDVICEKVVRLQGDFLDIIPKNKLTSEIIVNAIEQNYLNTFYVPSEFFNNKSVALASVKNNGIYLKQLPVEMKNDFDVVSTALFSSHNAAQFIGLSFQHYLEDFKENSLPNTPNWEYFPEYFYSKYNEDRLRKLLIRQKTFNFDDPTKNTLETEYDLYEDQFSSNEILDDDEQDESGSNGGHSGRENGTKNKTIRKKI